MIITFIPKTAASTRMETQDLTRLSETWVYFINIMDKSCLPSYASLEESPTAITRRYSVVFPRSFVSAHSAQSFWLRLHTSVVLCLLNNVKHT